MERAEQLCGRRARFGRSVPEQQCAGAGPGSDLERVADHQLDYLPAQLHGHALALYHRDGWLVAAGGAPVSRPLISGHPIPPPPETKPPPSPPPHVLPPTIPPCKPSALIHDPPPFPPRLSVNGNLALAQAVAGGNPPLRTSGDLY